jgi:hypothetical protein
MSGAATDRVKLAIAALFPALGLVITGPLLLTWNNICLGSPASAFVEVKQCDSAPVCCSDAAARPVNSRVGKPFGKNSILPLEPNRSSSKSEHPRVIPERLEGPVFLQTYWQFLWRAAAEPRAPSSVSNSFWFC